MVTKRKKTISKGKKQTTVKEPKMKSFAVVKKDLPFFTLRVTKQTVYWSILLIFVLLMQLWILNAQLDVIDTLDSINASIGSE